MPVWGSHSRPPLQPPSRQELGPGFTLKSQSRRPLQEPMSKAQLWHRGPSLTQMRPLQLLGTEKDTVWEAFWAHLCNRVYISLNLEKAKGSDSPSRVIGGH